MYQYSKFFTLNVLFEVTFLRLIDSGWCTIPNTTYRTRWGEILYDDTQCEAFCDPGQYETACVSVLRHHSDFQVVAKIKKASHNRRERSISALDSRGTWEENAKGCNDRLNDKQTGLNFAVSQFNGLLHLRPILRLCFAFFSKITTNW